MPLKCFSPYDDIYTVAGKQAVPVKRSLGCRLVAGPKSADAQHGKSGVGGIINWARLAGSLALGTGFVFTLCLAAALGLLETRPLPVGMGSSLLLAHLLRALHGLGT